MTMPRSSCGRGMTWTPTTSPIRPAAAAPNRNSRRRSANRPMRAPTRHPTPNTSRSLARMPNGRSGRRPSPSRPRHHRRPSTSPTHRYKPSDRKRMGASRAPTAVLLKCNLGVFGNLRRSWCERAEHDRSRDCREGYSAANQGNGSQTAQLMSDSHTYSPAPRGLPAASQISSDTRR